jgi:hypothetical protein
VRACQYSGPTPEGKLTISAGLPDVSSNLCSLTTILPNPFYEFFFEDLHVLRGRSTFPWNTEFRGAHLIIFKVLLPLLEFYPSWHALQAPPANRYIGLDVLEGICIHDDFHQRSKNWHMLR